MARLVSEIMNAELFSVSPDDTAERALDALLGLGITAAPVLDTQWRLLGVIALRDLARKARSGTVRQHMSSPAVVIRRDALISEAARLLAETGLRHLVVVDDRAHAVGMVSAIDVLRGLVGMPAGHPASFPHIDLKSGLCFTDERLLRDDRVEVAPDGPGIIVLVHGDAGSPDRIVWVESANNVRARLMDMLSTPQDDRPGLARWLERPGLRFRAAAVTDPEARARAVDDLRSTDSPLRPAGV